MDSFHASQACARTRHIRTAQITTLSFYWTPSKKLILFTTLVVSISTVPLSASILIVANYSYNTDPTHATFYRDDTGVELTDGVTDTVVWPDTGNPAFDFEPLVGWFDADGDITFNFAETSTINSMTIWFADSDDNSGVVMPNNVTIAGEGIFAVTNPAGNGTTVPVTISGLNIETNNLNLILNNSIAGKWNMISEVRFEGSVIPEPSSYALVVGMFGLGLATARRKRG